MTDIKKSHPSSTNTPYLQLRLSIQSAVLEKIIIFFAASYIVNLHCYVVLSFFLYLLLFCALSLRSDQLEKVKKKRRTASFSVSLHFFMLFYHFPFTYRCFGPSFPQQSIEKKWKIKDLSFPLLYYTTANAFLSFIGSYIIWMISSLP